ncbi:hypothetical protein KVR01_003616 [Diaporthe batatas]|uniref:uncharacterized protein n=1 Tax=Diaporthe batatas TaxID=748121 RepID=UPI001D0420BD|nr:uncharacterized protein KVR01_003616 [Diaporthe batatas]KAG8167927.1 hypothetical protein KVR01_003616 [Diaporthe batatas]
MQPSTVLVLAASAATGLAQSCTYQAASYLSVCQQGNNLFCTGNTGVCSNSTDTFDEQATIANEDACGPVGWKEQDLPT